MKKAIIAALLTLGVLVAGASPALAAYHGTTTYKWSHAGYTVTAESIVNQHDFFGWVEALGQYKTSGGCFNVNVDYTRLYRNGALDQSNEGDQYVSLSTGWWSQSSGWDDTHWTGTYYTSIRFRFIHCDGHTSGWIVLNSNSWTQ